MPRSNKLKLYRRCYCLLPEEATAKDASEMNCGVGGHAHLNFAELYGDVDYAKASEEIRRLGAKYKGAGGDLARGEVEWLCFPRVVRLRREPEKRKAQRIQLNDLSARVGPFLAGEARKRKHPQLWAQVLLAAVQGRREPPTGPTEV